MEPGFAIAVEFRMACLMQLGRRDAFAGALSRYESPLQEVFETMYELIWGDKALEMAKVEGVIQSLRQAKQPPLLAWDLYLLLHAGHVQPAMQLLAAKAAGKSGQVINFQYDPLLKPLQPLKEYRELVQRYFPDNVLLTVGEKRVKAKDYLIPEEAKYYA